MRNLSSKGSPDLKYWVFLVLLITITIIPTNCEEKEKNDQAENTEIKYKFPKKTGAINLEDIQQFDEVNKILDEDIDLRVKEATEKMMAMTIEDNVDHIDDDIANYDMSTMPKDFGPTMKKKRPYSLSQKKKKSKKKKRSRRSLIQRYTEMKQRRTNRIFQRSKILERKKQTLSKNFKGRPVQVLSLQKGKAVNTHQISDHSILKTVHSQAPSKIKMDNERQLRDVHGQSYVNDVYNIIRKNNKKIIKNQRRMKNHFRKNKSKKHLKARIHKRKLLRKKHEKKLAEMKASVLKKKFPPKNKSQLQRKNPIETSRCTLKSYT